jgi:hypothetical protein
VIGIGSQSLVAVARVQVDQEVGLRNDLRRNLVRDALAQRTVGPSGKDAVEILAVGGAGVDRAAVKRRRIGDMHQDQRAAQSARIDRLAQSLQCADAGVFIAVSSGDQRQHRPFARAAHERYRDPRAVVAQRGDLQVAGNRLPGTRAQRSKLREIAGMRTARHGQERHHNARDHTHGQLRLRRSGRGHHAVCGFMSPAAP